MQDFGDSGRVTGEVPLGTFWYAASAPGDEDVLGKGSVRVSDFDKSVLDATLVEVFDQVGKFAL